MYLYPSNEQLENEMKYIIYNSSHENEILRYKSSIVTGTLKLLVSSCWLFFPCKLLRFFLIPHMSSNLDYTIDILTVMRISILFESYGKCYFFFFACFGRHISHILLYNKSPQTQWFKTAYSQFLSVRNLGEV